MQCKNIWENLSETEKDTCKMIDFVVWSMRVWLIWMIYRPAKIYVSCSITDRFFQIFLYWMQIIFFYLPLLSNLWCVTSLSQYSRITFFLDSLQPIYILFHHLSTLIWCPLFCHFFSFHTLSSWLYIINRNLQIINVLNRRDLFSTHKLSKRVLITYYYIHIKCYQIGRASCRERV